MQDFEGAYFEETTILPNGVYWTSKTDMSRFTDPEHPDYWVENEDFIFEYEHQDGELETIATLEAEVYQKMEKLSR